MVILEEVVSGLPIWATVLFTLGGMVVTVVTSYYLNVGSKKAGLYKAKYDEIVQERNTLKKENEKYRVNEIKYIEQALYHDKTIKRFIKIEMLKDPEGAEALKILLDD